MYAKKIVTLSLAILLLISAPVFAFDRKASFSGEEDPYKNIAPNAFAFFGEAARKLYSNSEARAVIAGIVPGTDADTSDPFCSNLLLVRMKTGTSLVDTYGAVDLETDGNGQYVLRYASIEETKNAYEAIQAQEQCEYAAPDLIGEGIAFEETEKPAAIPDNQAWGRKRIAANWMKEYLIRNEKTDTELIVALLDGGLNYTHEHIEGRSIQGRNFVDIYPPDDLKDNMGHATHVAGTIIDCTPENVKIMPVRVMDSRGKVLMSEVVDGIKWAAEQDNVKIFNMSIIFRSEWDGEWDLPLKEACEYAVSKGITLVTGSGNTDEEVKYSSPARLDGVVTVAGTDKFDNRWKHEEAKIGSNYGPEVDFCAPADSIVSSTRDNKYQGMSGTSTSTPFIVAGIAMMMLDNPNLDPEGIIKTLSDTTEDLGDPGWDPYFGWGILDFRLYPGVEEPSPSPEPSSSLAPIPSPSAKPEPSPSLAPTPSPSPSPDTEIGPGKVRLPISGAASVPYYRTNGEDVLVKMSTVENGEAIFDAPLKTEYTLKNNQKNFNDVSPSHWGAGHIDFVTQREIFNGQGDGIFNPSGTTTRGMFVTVLANLHNVNEAEYRSKPSPFTDVQTSAWYGWAVTWAAENNIVAGTSETTFTPNAPITREQMALIVTRYAEFAGVEINQIHPKTEFSDDIQITSWAKDAVYTLQSAGIVSGKDAGRFDPKAFSQRAEISAIMCNFITHVLTGR